MDFRDRSVQMLTSEMKNNLLIKLIVFIEFIVLKLFQHASLKRGNKICARFDKDSIENN